MTAVCFAFASQVWTYAGKRVGSSTVTHIRLWLALPLSIIVHFIIVGSFFPLHHDPKAYLYFALSGLFGFALADLFIFKSLVILGARQTLVIMTVSPIFSTFISWFSLSERISYLQIIGILIIVAGVMWVIFEEGRNNSKSIKGRTRGIIFAFIGALAQSSANVLSKHGFAYDVHPVSAGLLRVTFGLLGLIIFALSRKEFINDFKKMDNIKILTLLTSASFIGPILGVILSLYALTMAPVGIVSALMQISPIILLPVDYFVFKKKIGIKIILGTFLAIAGAVLLFVL